MDDAALDALLPSLSYEHRDSESRYRIQVERRGAVVAILLQGSLLTPAPESFVERVADTLGRLKRRGVIIDLINCEYLSSSAISHLIRYADAAGRVGCKVAMIGPQPKVKVVLDLLGLESVCPILSDDTSTRRWLAEHGLDA